MKMYNILCSIVCKLQPQEKKKEKKIQSSVLLTDAKFSFRTIDGSLVNGYNRLIIVRKEGNFEKKS